MSAQGAGTPLGRIRPRHVGKLPTPVPQGCGVVEGDLQVLTCATQVALVAGAGAPFVHSLLIPLWHGVLLRAL